MAKSVSKRMGRPPVDSEAITVRLRRDLLDWLDAERTKMDPEPSRPEMIRIYLEERRGRMIMKD
ncbi:hypothetical protein JHW45_06240 [Paracoccus stylophorae]|uniref:Ribbon-helix-helix protein CopG domain-containing protein n=1 Tax=Paracoccus stylophorae TaxID=659350 RepID=A0ABY7SYL5_9RHOB|nr:hypothetical protein [Paracoccus stylophorae]WCR11953.1 hypothetical protein JHW45_06240 [Paracoccus stylophorae]